MSPVRRPLVTVIDVIAVASLMTALSGCASDGAHGYSPGEVAIAIGDSWERQQIFVDGDSFSAAEQRCIDRVGRDISVADVEASHHQTFAQSPERVKDFMAAMFDECLTDAHMQRWFFTDMDGRQDLMFTDEKADCLSQALPELVHDVGYVDLFRERTPTAAAGLERARKSCGITGEVTADTEP